MAMNLEQALDEFYAQNNIPLKGGIDQDTFQLKFGWFKLTLPNPQYRKDILYIHDLQHVLNNCDTSWKGEGFIAGWEIATGLVKRFPIGLYSLGAVGYSVWMYPKTVFQGYRKGRNEIGIIDLGLSKQELLQLDLNELIAKTKKGAPTTMGLPQWLSFVAWVFISQLFFLGPLATLVLLIWMLLAW